MSDTETRVRALGAERKAVRMRLADLTARLADAVADAYRQGYAACDIIDWAGVARRTYYVMVEGVPREEKRK